MTGPAGRDALPRSPRGAAAGASCGRSAPSWSASRSGSGWCSSSSWSACSRRRSRRTCSSGKLIVTSPTEPVMIVFKLGLRGRAGARLAGASSGRLWAFLAPALYEREKKALVPALFVGLVLFLIGAVLAYLLRGAAGAAGAVQLPERGDRSRSSPTTPSSASCSRSCSRSGISFELPARHRDPLLARRDRPGGAAPVPALRHRAARSSPGAVLSPGADLLSMLMMTVPLLLLYEVGVAGVGHRAPAPARRAAIAALVLLAPGRRRDPGRGAGAGQRRPAGGLARDTMRAGLACGSTTGTPAGPVARQRHRPAAGPADRAVPELRPAGLGGERAARPAGLSPPPGTAPTRPRCSCESERGPAAGRGADRATGRACSRPTPSPTGSDSCVLDARGRPASLRRGARCWWARGSATTPAAGAGSSRDALTNFTEGSHRLVPAGQRGPGLELQPDLRRLERDHQLRPADAPLSLRGPAR